MTEPEIFVGIDIGGTNIKAVCIDKNGDIASTLQCKTPTRNPESVAIAVADLLKKLCVKYAISFGGLLSRRDKKRPCKCRQS